ncbi:MAG: class I SAM-dependent methyltransferase [Bryobacterales bacterium]|nr:class I SAM-dependent methyltransferase [Bryobacteraceae bacterium]MDW8131712.1 class I SAM-dependent methyltransferase [Bryobacterales bacterium]
MSERATKPAVCPACDDPNFRLLFHATDRLYRTTTEVFRIIECSRCGLIRLDPWPAQAEMSRYYPDTYWFVPGDAAADRLEEAWRRLVLADHVEFVRAALRKCPAEGLVLDVGCGGGLFVRLLRERGFRAIGLDLSPKAAALAWQVNRVPVICANLRDAPLPEASCAAITMFHVLEHLEDPTEYLEAAHRLLAPDGRLIVQTPNAASWQFLLLGENWSGLDVPRHLLNFRASDLEYLLKCCGFQVRRRKFFSLRDNPAGLATSLAPWLDPMARRVRRLPEGPRLRLFKDLLYLGLLAASLPFTLLEAACRAGSTVMLEASKES